MKTSDWLDARRRELIPSREELHDVQVAVDAVCSSLRDNWRIAEIYPCGSAAKGTMLRGRKEADVVLILRDAPTPQTLESFNSTLAASAGVHRSAIRHKAVEVQFQSGVSVDVLPAALSGLTEDGGSIPRKHRRALDGPAHVTWFNQEGHATGAHDIVRLAKHWRDIHGLDLSSFGLEVLTVNALRSTGGGSLEDRFAAVLERLAQGQIRVQDPARLSEWINDLARDEIERLSRVARSSLEQLRQSNPSRAFAGSSYPSTLTGIGGTPLA